jgi:hypothetical protein
VLFYQADFLFHIQVILGKPGDAKPKWPILENQIGTAIIINELSDVTALVVQGSEAPEIPVITINLVTDGHSNAGHFVSTVINVHVHDVSFGLGVEKDLGPFDHPSWAEVFRVADLENLISKAPVRQVL